MKTFITNEAYHADAAIGSTTLKTIDKKSVLHAVNQTIKETDALVFGSALHCLILEPEQFDDKYAVKPVCDRRTKLGKELYAEFLEESEGKTIITQEQHTAVHGIAKSLANHPLVSNMLQGGESEVSYFADDSFYQVTRKCRLDYFKNGTIIDIKTCTDASPQGFLRSVIKYNYHLQASYYLDTVNMSGEDTAKDFVFVAVENTFPYAVGVYKLDQQSLNAGRNRYKAALTKLAEFKTSDKPVETFGYSQSLVELELPLWELEQAELKGEE